jgi:hypothetical protein
MLYFFPTKPQNSSVAMSTFISIGMGLLDGFLGQKDDFLILFFVHKQTVLDGLFSKYSFLDAFLPVNGQFFGAITYTNLNTKFLLLLMNSNEVR